MSGYCESILAGRGQKAQVEAVRPAPFRERAAFTWARQAAGRRGVGGPVGKPRGRQPSWSPAGGSPSRSCRIKVFRRQLVVL